MVKEKKELPPGGAAKKRPRIKIQRPADITRLLNRLIGLSLIGAVPVDVHRVITYSCQVILRVWEIETLEQRLSRLEELITK